MAEPRDWTMREDAKAARSHIVSAPGCQETHWVVPIVWPIASPTTGCGYVHFVVREYESGLITCDASRAWLGKTNRE